MKYSSCCDAAPLAGMEELGICGKCREHCDFYDDSTDDQSKELSDIQQAIVDRMKAQLENDFPVQPKAVAVVEPADKSRLDRDHQLL